MPADDLNKITIIRLNKNKEKGIPSVFVTAYDYPQAQLADLAGVDGILIGDSCGMTVHGYPTTIGVTMDQMVMHTQDVVRGAKRPFIISDFPFGSYQSSNELAVRNAERFIIAGADCVKVEGAMVDRIAAIAKAGILVMSHLGLTPHTRAKLGGYKVQGKTKKDFDVIRDQALKLQDAGCSLLLLEAMPRESAGLIVESLSIPVYGIGAGDLVDGQLTIFHDLVGLFSAFKSKFVKRYLEGGELLKGALQEYVDEVRNKAFPSEEHFYEIKEEELEKLLADTSWKYTKDDGPTELKKIFTHPGC